MPIDRRALLRSGLLLGAATVVAPLAHAETTTDAPPAFVPKPGAWRTFEVTTELVLPTGLEAAQAWVPIPAFHGDGWIRPGETTWTTAEGGSGAKVVDPASGAGMLHLTWPAGAARTATVTSRFSARDRAIETTRESTGATLTAEETKYYTAATSMLPTDGIVAETARKITAGATSDLDKARRLYEWIVDNTFRDPKTRGCGTGDIATMLETGNLGGKCADLNALYVGLARSTGLPARDVYGLRVAKSNFGYKSLGASSPVISKAQHCRAEVFIAGSGWVAVDPADVRKVVLEEPPGKLALDDPKVVAARKALFGSWETNWLAYNDAHDVRLPGSSGPVLPYLMYPQAEIAGTRVDCLDPDAFKYVITAREVTT